MTEYIIRKETPADWAEVENLTREAFWDVYRPGCDEHLIVHNLRHHKASIEALNHVVECEGRIIGHIQYTHSQIHCDGAAYPAVTFGPISVLPEVQRRGVGSLLIRHTLPLAKEMGFPGVLIEGNPDYYHRFGFADAEKWGITTAEGDSGPWLMAIEFIPGALHAGRIHHAAPFEVDPVQLEEFETHFPFKEKRYKE